MGSIEPLRMTAERADLFRAWRVTESGTAYKLDIGAPDTWEDAEAESQLGKALQHKDTLLIHRAHPTGGELRAYTVKQKSQPVYRKCEATGLTKPFKPLYLARQFSLPVDAFEPRRPFDALRDDPVGRDLGLVEG